MGAKKRRINDSVSKRMTRKKVRKDESDPAEAKILPLTFLPEEKPYCDDHMKTRLSLKVEEKSNKNFFPRVKITCVPLNVEKIIDFGNSNGVSNAMDDAKSNLEKKSRKGTQGKTKRSKKAGNQGVMDNGENLLPIEPSKHKVTKTRNKVKESKKMDCANVSPVTSPSKGIRDDPNKEQSPEILANESQSNCGEQILFSSSSSKETDLKNENCQISPNQSYEKHLNVDVDNVEAQDSACLPFCRMDDESGFFELNNVILEELSPISENTAGETSKTGGNKNVLEEEANVTRVLTSSTFLSSNNSVSIGCKDLYQLGEVQNNLTSQNKSFLQASVESFLSNPQLKCLKETSSLKKGLCFTWLTNNYVCANQQCFYSHSAVKLFTKKMRTYPSKFILSIVASMTNDILFVDVIMAAFKILSARKIPAIWMAFLIYFVFYVTEPSDSRFLKFWANAARFYCQLNNGYTAGNGFPSLLAIFSNCEKSEEWKIIDFIKLIKKPPIQVSTNYELLRPVLKLDLPSQFLTDAVESCIATQKDLLNVYLCIIPKISLMTSPIQTVELLLKFSKILEAVDLITHADDLRRRLLIKVKSFKTKITPYDYPLTSAFQDDIYLGKSENEGLDLPESHACAKKQSESLPLEAINHDNNYFQLENDLGNLMVQTLELTCAAASGRLKVQSFLNNRNNESQRDELGERQISRIQQFFSDCRFDLLGKYLNDLEPHILEQAAEEFIKFLFQMKISLQQGVDLIRLILLQCKSDSAAKVVASVCITFILNLIWINEWEKAYTIMTLCHEKQVNLIEGKVFYFNEFNAISQCRIALLLIEINAYNGNYQRAMKLIKSNFLFSSNKAIWKLTWKPYDENIRIKILEDFLQQVIFKQSTEIMYDLFVSVWKDQKQLNGLIDLRKFVNEVIIMMLNEGSDEALTLYENVKPEVRLNDITVRAVLVTMVRLNRLSAAKIMLKSSTQNVYSLPHVTSGCATVMISNFWLEEEIYMVFDVFLELLAAKKRTNECGNVEINIQITKPNLMPTSKITPLCLGIINPAFKDVCNRIQRVFYQFSSPLKLIIMPYYLKIDEHSLQIHLHNRVHQNAKNDE